MEKLEIDKSQDAEYVCRLCGGEGKIFIDTTNECIKQPSNCCGGCGYYADCTECNENNMEKLEIAKGIIKDRIELLEDFVKFYGLESDKLRLGELRLLLKQIELL